MKDELTGTLVTVAGHQYRLGPPSARVYTRLASLAIRLLSGAGLVRRADAGDLGGLQVGLELVNRLSERELSELTAILLDIDDIQAFAAEIGPAGPDPVEFLDLLATRMEQTDVAALLKNFRRVQAAWERINAALAGVSWESGRPPQKS